MQPWKRGLSSMLFGPERGCPSPILVQRSTNHTLQASPNDHRGKIHTYLGHIAENYKWITNFSSKMWFLDLLGLSPAALYCLYWRRKRASPQFHMQPLRSPALSSSTNTPPYICLVCLLVWTPCFHIPIWPYRKTSLVKYVASFRLECQRYCLRKGHPLYVRDYKALRRIYRGCYATAAHDAKRICKATSHQISSNCPTATLSIKRNQSNHWLRFFVFMA